MEDTIYDESVHTCNLERCTEPIGDGDYASGYRQCVWHRPGPHRSARR